MSATESPVSTGRSTARTGRWTAFSASGLIPELIAGVVMGALMVTFSISMATLLYGAIFPEQLDRVIGLALLGTLAVATMVMLLGSRGGIVAHIQDAPAAILAPIAAAVAASWTSTQIGESADLSLFMSVFATVAFTTLATGTVLLLFGQFRLGRLVRYLPYPVIGGFMAGTGWLIVSGGLAVMTGEPLGIGLLRSLLATASLGSWLPGMVLALGLLVVSRKSKHYLAWPTAILGTTLLFYLVVLVSGRPLSQWRSDGFLLGPFPEADLLQGLAPGDLAFVDWGVVMSQLPTIATVAGLSLMALLLNSTAIELLSDDRVDLDRELRSAGIGNLLAGALGGQVGYQSVSMSSLNRRAGTGGRTALIVAIGVVGATLLFGASLLEYVPTLLVGGLITFLGLDFLYEWLVESYSRLALLEYGVVVVIVVIIALTGFLPGVAVGLLLAVVLFVLDYGRIDAVRHVLNGSEIRSTVRRDPSEQRAIAAAGSEVLILQLQGYLFFGTTNAVLKRLEERLQAGPLHEVILDFRRVTGVDADAVVAMKRILANAGSAGYRLYLSHLGPAVIDDFKRRGLLARLKSSATIFPTLDAALEDSEDRRLARTTQRDRALGHEPGHGPEPTEVLAAFSKPGGSRALSAALGVGSDLSAIEPFLERLELRAGERLIAQGDPPNAVYFVADGRLSAWLENGEDERLRLESMRVGTVVGELAFFTGEPRSASVVADEASVVFQLSAAAMERLTAADPQAGAKLATALARLTAERVRHLMTTVAALQR